MFSKSIFAFFALPAFTVFGVYSYDTMNDTTITTKNNTPTTLQAVSQTVSSQSNDTTKTTIPIPSKTTTPTNNTVFAPHALARSISSVHEASLQNGLFVGEANELAQGCYSIQSPNTNKYITHMKSADTINDGMTYKFGSEDVAQFYFKPTSINNTFMLRDTNGRFFGTHLPLQISAGKTAGEFVEWKIDKTGNNTYTLKAVKLNRTLKQNKRNNNLYLYNWVFFGEQDFNLVKAEGCADFPEITTNVEGSNDLLKGDARQPVRGFIDPHTHISSFQFMGGRMMAGKPFSRWGVEDALKDSKDVHGAKGSLDIIGNLLGYEKIDYKYDTRGWPDFPSWPNYQQMSHMGYYYKWIERAHRSGMRLMVTNLVENEVLCNLQKAVNPSGWVSTNSCKTMDSLRKQIDVLYEMQDYIDAQAGGKGKGFFRIVTSPTQAREVIANGQLAVVLGIEATETFNCGLKDKNCTKESVEAQLDEMYDLGIRSLFPVHKFDNRFGGSPVENGLMNAGQWLSTGEFFATEECDAHTQGMKMENGFPLVGKLPFFKEVLDAVKLNPQYDESVLHCNKKGITPLGVHLVNRMIDKKMMIELDHMSTKTAKSVLDIAEHRGNYSGLISSHSWMTKNKTEIKKEIVNYSLDHPTKEEKRLSAPDDIRHYNTLRMLKAGGFVGAYNFETYKMNDSVGLYLEMLEKTPYLQGVGISTDMSGLGDQAPPRRDAEMKPLKYPFTTEFGTVVHKQKSGNRQFDINKDGMAHFGMLPDHVQDIRETDSRVYESLMNSAEAYLQMWERTENTVTTEHYDPIK